MTQKSLQSSSLRNTLRSNAVFSTVCAVTLITAAPKLAGMFGLDQPWIFRIIGIGLLLFAGDILYSIHKGLSRIKAIYFVCGDFAWVLGTAVILTAFPDSLTHTGRTILVAVSTVVLILGVLQEVFLMRAWRTTPAAT